MRCPRRSWAKRFALIFSGRKRHFGKSFSSFVWTFDSDFTALEYSYFSVAPIFKTKAGAYADPTAAIRLPALCWTHPLQDLLAALLEAGFTLTRFEEYDFSTYNCFHNTMETVPAAS
jgi:hypothetical protein